MQVNWHDPVASERQPVRRPAWKSGARELFREGLSLGASRRGEGGSRSRPWPLGSGAGALQVSWGPCGVAIEGLILRERLQQDLSMALLGSRGLLAQDSLRGRA